MRNKGVHSFAALTLLAAMTAGQAMAQGAPMNAAWLAAPGSGNYNTGSNWSTGVVPSGTATFNASTITALSFTSSVTSAAGWTFNPGASSYTFSIGAQLFSFTGNGIVVNGGAAAINNNGALTFTNSSTAGAAAINNAATLSFSDHTSAGNAAITNIGAGALVQFTGNATGGSARLVNKSGAVADFSGSTGPNGDNRLTIGSIEGNGLFYLGANQLTVGGNNLAALVDSVISDCGASGSACNAGTGTLGGSLVKAGAGTLTLSAVNTYTGATNVTAGTLNVTGSIAASSLLTISVNAMVTGTGTLGTTQVQGTLQPGTASAPTGTLNVAGNITFNTGSIYAIRLMGGQVSSASATGTAALAGTLQLTISGVNKFGTYTVLTAASGRSGTFDALGGNYLGSALAPSLGYTPTSVVVALNPAALTPLVQGAGSNAGNLAAALDAARQRGADLSPLFALYSLPSGQIAGALNQLTGEAATLLPAIGFQIGGDFMSRVLDPRLRAPGVSGTSGPLALAAEPAPPPAVTAADGAAAAPFQRVMRVWADASATRAHQSGNTRTGASATITSQQSLLAGADLQIDPNTVIGFAAGAGVARGRLANGLGASSINLTQTGLYGGTHFGNFYLQGVTSYAWLNTQSTRTVTFNGGSILNSSYTAHLWSGRLESGYRLDQPLGTLLPDLSLSPYAALEAQRIFTPGFSELDLSGSGFGVGISGNTTKSTRTELGSYADYRLTLQSGEVFAFFARAAWAHEFDTGRSLTVSLNAIPGVSFRVDGARSAPDLALLSAGVDIKLSPFVTFGTRMDGEVSPRSHQVAGSARLTVNW